MRAATSITDKFRLGTIVSDSLHASESVLFVEMFSSVVLSRRTLEWFVGMTSVAVDN
jgi:hypothetical protein